MSVTDKIKMIELTDDQFFKEETTKTMIFIHHTAGNSSPFGVIKDWQMTPERVATHFVIGGIPSVLPAKWSDGDILQTYSTKYWGHHLGLKPEHLVAGGKSNKELNMTSISIELCNWGPLTKNAAGKYLTYINTVVPEAQVVHLDAPYKGYSYYHAYTDAQLASLKELLVFLCDKWTIPKKYFGDKIFQVCHEALIGTPGIFTHTSVRPDKSDCYPHPQLIQLLQHLE
jgi:N-acetyl-anhydromuramyl-L-alanine amidase AmpD